jgi:hypothetical protein
MKKTAKTIASLVAAASLGAGWTARAEVPPPSASPATPPLYGGEPAAAPAAPSPAPPSPGPIVLLRTDNPHATLQVQTQLYWRDVCIAPCATPVDPAGLYRVGGRPFVPSEPFALPRRSGQVTIEARMGSKARNIVGTVLTLAGLGATATGAFLYYEGSQQPNDPYGFESPSRFILHAYGAIALIAGVALTLTGIPLWASSGTSTQIE